MSRIQKQLCFLFNGTDQIPGNTKTVFLVIVIFLSLVILLTNAFVILVYATNRKLRSKVNISHLFIFVAGALWGGLLGPSLIAELIISSSYEEPQFCNARATLMYSIIFVTGFSVVSITHTAVLKACEMRQQFSRKPFFSTTKVIAWNITLWIFFVLFPAVFPQIPGASDKHFAIVVAVFLFLAGTKVVFAYGFIAKEIYSSRQRLRQLSESPSASHHVTATKKIVMILVTFVVAHVMLFIEAVRFIVDVYKNPDSAEQDSLENQMFVVSAIIVSGVHPLLNPFIYFSGERKAIVNTMRIIFRCKAQDAHQQSMEGSVNFIGNTAVSSHVENGSAIALADHTSK